eukprot:gnl/Trimastix_PCT/2504.p1 GENE.gnl/Trimastix_PCT/2504~~gnl/Trimastix_PCT/2504.p1  ORF type:complete len:304 (-),score=14.39 gnl/Trimastix_PCT/2504:1005-1916(-)
MLWALVLIGGILFCILFGWKSLQRKQRPRKTKHFWAGKNVMLTGASGAIGEALAQQLVTIGCNLFITTSHDVSRLESLRTRLIASQDKSYHVVTGQCDMRSEDSCRQAVRECVATLDSMDVLLLNAAHGVIHPIPLATPDFMSHAKDYLEINVAGNMVLVHAALPHLKQTKGTILFVGSTASLVGVPLESLYSASKYAMRGFFEALRHEVRHDVRISIAHPPWIATPDVMKCAQERSQALKTKLPVCMPIDTCAAMILETPVCGWHEHILSDSDRWIPWLRVLAPKALQEIVRTDTKMFNSIE